MMMKAVWSGVVASAVLTLVPFSTAVQAQQQTATALVTATAAVAAKARLAVSGAVSFADADPDDFPFIDAPAITVTVKARTAPLDTVTLTVLAGNDLTAGTAVIAINNLSWTAAGAGFAAGTASKAAAQPVGSWTAPGTHSGTQIYRLVNSWAYATGTYSVTLTYTLTAP